MEGNHTETKDALVSVAAVNDKLIASYLKARRAGQSVFALDGSPVRELVLPGIGTVGALGQANGNGGVLFVTSFTQPA